MGFGARLAHAWNVFTNVTEDYSIRSGAHRDFGSATGSNPSRIRVAYGNDKTIITSIYTRIAIDVASFEIRHVKLDEEKRYLEDMDSGLNNILSLEANIDQHARHFLKDHVLKMFTTGTGTMVPIDYSNSPLDTGSWEIKTMRVGEVVQWYPHHVRVRCYNEDTGRHEEITVLKRLTALVENPLYEVMNEPNSTLQRLARKLSLLDAVDEQSASGKLDIIIQVPYTVTSESLKKRARERRQDMEWQLSGSKYGIAYADGSEKITQLNRPAENNLMNQIEYLVKMLYGQLGITAEVMDGTADEATMLNYYNRTVEPILGSMCLELKRKFLTKTARSQGQSVEYYRDPFRLIPMKDFGELADKLSRNEIFTPNELRQYIGARPSKDPKADELYNSNMAPRPTAVVPGEVIPGEVVAVEDTFAEVNAVLDDAFLELGVSE